MKCFHGSHVVLVSILQRNQNSSILCLTCALSITPPADGGWQVCEGVAFMHDQAVMHRDLHALEPEENC